MIERGTQEKAINWKALFKLGENWRNGAHIPHILHSEVPICLVRSMHGSNV